MDELRLLKQSQEDLKWFVNNFEELRENYGHKVLAVKNKRVVATGDNMQGLLSKLEEKGIPQESVLIKQIRPKNEITIFRGE